MSSVSFVLLGGDILHYSRINCLKSWVRLWLFEGKRGANEQLINYPPRILTHNPLAFWLAFHEEQIYKRLLEILQLLKLNWAALLLRHIRGFSLLVVHCFPQPERTASVHCLELPWKCRCHCNPAHPKLVYSMSLTTLCFVVFFLHLPRLDVLVTVVIPRLESSLSVTEVANCLLVVAPANEDSKLLSECSIAVPPLKLL